MANPTFKDFGNKEEAKHQGSRKDLMLLKRAVDAGVTEEQLGVLYPQILKLYSGFVNNYLIKAKRLHAPKESASHDLEMKKWWNETNRKKTI